MRKSITLLLAVVMAASSCRNSDSDVIREVKVKGKILTEINIDNIPTEVVRMNLSDLFTDFSIIALETSDSSLLMTSGSFAWTTDSDIFISFQPASGGLPPARLMRFDRKGDFINEIGRGGNGPGEHQGYMLTQIIHDDEEKTVVAPWEGSSNEGPMIYGYDGEWLGQVRFPMEMINGAIYPHKDEEWFWAGGATGNPFMEKDSVLIVFFSEKGEITGTVPRTTYPPAGSDKYTPPGFGSSVYRHDGKYRVYFPGIDTIFTISDRSIVPSIILTGGKEMLPFNRQVDPSTLPGKYRLNIIAENDNNILMTKSVIISAEVHEFRPGQWGGSYNTEEYLVVIDKQTGKAITADVRDDVLGLFPDMNLTALFMFLSGNRISMPFEALVYLETLKGKGIDKEKMLEMAVDRERLKALDENSNPIITTYLLKEHINIK
jgi:hypothetical protein